MSRIKVGIIGVGNMGKNHLRLVREMSNLFEFVGVADPDKDRVKQLEIPEDLYLPEDELIDKADAVVVAAPSSFHKKIALNIAKRKKHLLVEKPIALSEEDAKEVADAFKDIGKVLMVGHVERFNPTVLELEKILRDEKIVAIHVERCSSMDKRISDTDVVYDLMIHDIDIVLNAMNPGAEVKRIASFGKKVYSENYVDYVESAMQFDNGIIASVISSRSTESKIRRVFVHCESGFIDADLLNRTLSISRKTTYHLNVGYDPVYKQENVVEKVFVSNVEPLRAELQHFYDCIVEGKKPRTSGESAVKSIHVLDMIKADLY